MDINSEDIERHLNILGPREFYCLVTRNFKTKDVQTVWLPKNKVVPWTKEMNASGYQVWISINNKALEKDSLEGVVSLDDFFIDVDAERKEKNKLASNDELIGAFDKIAKVKEHLNREYGAEAYVALSGNGWHIHLPLPKHSFDTYNSKVETNLKLKKFREKIAGASGVVVDPVHDLRRLAALIGSLNLKIPDMPRLTAWCRPTDREPDIEKARAKNALLLQAILEMPIMENTESCDAENQLTNHADLGELLKADHKLADLYEGNWKEYKFKTRSEAEQSLLLRLVQYSFSDTEILKAMENSKIGKWQERDDSYRTHSIRKAREFAVALEPNASSPVDLIDQELLDIRCTRLHPLIDFHPDTGYTFGLFVGKEKAFQIVNKKVKAFDTETPLIEEPNSPPILVTRPNFMVISQKWKEIILEIAKDLLSSKEIENKPRSDLFDFIVQKISHYFYHSDTRWHTFFACFIIGTYLHRIFSPFPHWVLQGVRASGKTTAAILLSETAWNPTPPQSGLKSAPLFRFIEDSRPTYIIDVTRFNYKDPDLIDLLEAIEPQSAVFRCVGEQKDEVKSFHPFSPKVLTVRQTVPFADKAAPNIAMSSGRYIIWSPGRARVTE